MSNLVNTNIPWLPYLKSDWKVLRVKNAFYASKEKAHQETPTILSLARSGVKIRDISNNEGQLAESYYDYNPVRPGDLLLNPMDLYSGANCNVSEVEGVISPAYANLRSKIKLEPKYFDFYFKTQYWTMAMFAHGKGVSFDNRWTLNNETLMNYELPFPPYEEQIRIVELLKDKIAKIDKLIANQDKQLETLIEFKKSFITEIVTKGIVKQRNYKYSGVKWIGYIPEEWVCCQNKYLFQKGDGSLRIGPFGSSLSGKTEPSGPYKIYNQAHLVSNDFSLNRHFISADTFENLKSYEILPDDILFSMMGTIGKCRIMPHGFQRGIMDSHLLKARLKNLILPKYYLYVFDKDYSNCVFQQLKFLSNGSIMDGLNSTIVKKVMMPLPPIEEQELIVEYLDIKCDEINRLIEIKQEKIEKLQEYKKSLIYEYVTGKKEV